MASPLRYARISSPINTGIVVGALTFWRPMEFGGTQPVPVHFNGPLGV